MRYMWISGVVIVALLGAGCGSSADKAAGHRHRHVSATSTTTARTRQHTTTPSTAAKLASGPKDKVACTTLTSLGGDAHKSHQVIANDFRKVFRDLKHAENTKLRIEGHRSAVELLQRKVKRFKTSFFSVFLVCDQMGLT
jgi:hypothetical protein